MPPCILSKKTGDSDKTLVKDVLTINLPSEQATNEYSLGKKIVWFFSGDAHMSVWLFNASLKTLDELACHAKGQKLLGRWTSGSQQHMIQ